MKIASQIRENPRPSLLLLYRAKRSSHYMMHKRNTSKRKQSGLRSLICISILLQPCTSYAQFAPRKCPSRPAAANVSTIASWSELKHLIETSAIDLVLPSFHIVKPAEEAPILLNSAIALSCVDGGACILAAPKESGAGTFIEIRGENANVRIQGITFKNASESAIVVAKHSGALVDDGEQLICESNFIGNQGHMGAAIRAHPKSRTHIESCTFTQNQSISGTTYSNEYGAGGGAVYNEGEMSVWYSTFDDNSSQIGVIYTGPKSKLSISQNTFMLGDDQYESSSIYVFADGAENFVDEGGNRGYEKSFDDGKTTSYCNGVYINNEDECTAFVEQPLQQLVNEPAADMKSQDIQVLSQPTEGLSSQITCTNTKGVFRNHLGDLKRCLWLLNDSRRNSNCNGLTELGRMCRKSCLEDCSQPLPPSNKDDESTTRKNRRKHKKEKIMKRRQREREKKLKASQEDQISSNQSPPKVPTEKPSRRPSPRPTPVPTSPERIKTQSNNKHDDIIFYVIGDAPYKVSELDPTTGFPRQVRGIPNDAEFVVHVGDILSAKESECHISWYQQVSFILRSSNAPVFITPGDNDWLDCEPYIGAKVALDQWQNTFDSFHSSWSPHKFDVQHQPTIRENMAFVHKNVLFLIVHLVSDYYDIESERQLRHSSQLAWANDQIDANKSNIDAVVIIGHSPPSSLNRDFFSERYGGIATTVKKLDIPVVYIHGSGHKFVEEENFNSLSNFLRIQVPGRQANPVRVSFDDSKRFYFDFNDDEIVPECCLDGWPRIERSNE